MWLLRGLFGFFFQGEEGIRDKLVTGVQTCALPISMMPQCNVPPQNDQMAILLNKLETLEKKQEKKKGEKIATQLQQQVEKLLAQNKEQQHTIDELHAQLQVKEAELRKKQ